ncbi:KipI family sensor histidine kinase inhibitor [Pseudoxanthomonas sp. 3HH-4]|uniref:5-oxoprolinase subunit PxpB n=1 Tax=Pseudoxanthomonas sp. 3HH-4 TaxID=1690214 RepID=UPI0011543DAA|nr:5-oxoprolinase subunit PxpB [Pseudoxanthomonas sp. 3HH-4]TQM12783.1 KipI family sensor histidine kinase inhibitor [Pseudoxanthomonas sp. 3HH-4]
MSGPRIEPLGDDALLVRFGDGIDDDTNQRVHALARHLRHLAPVWLRDLVPAYASLGVFFDSTCMSGDDPHDVVAKAMVGWAELPTPLENATATLHEIPVCYGAGFGEDLATAARELGLEEAELIARHSAPHYRVAMIGFAPGFPYLLGLDPGLALPRLATPRARVPAGSVAVGGAQTGIYPHASPGGWRLLGRTPLVLFDAQRDVPSLLLPGDEIRFVPIDAQAFVALAGNA